jgi:transmembrane sensor
MNCLEHKPTPEEIEAAASDWILRREEGLSEAEKIELDHWITAAPRNSEALARHEEAWSMLQKPKTAGRSEEMVRALSARATRRKHRRIGMAAASLVFLVAVGSVWKVNRPVTAKITPSIANAVVHSPEIQVLPDGTIAELKNGSSITVDFSGPLRRVSLNKGEALFQVAHDKTRPFVVTASGIEVRAVGTAFDVQLGTQQVSVVVTEGEVSVDRTSEDVSAQETPSGHTPSYVDAGKRMVVDISANQVQSAPVAVSQGEVDEQLAWRAPRLEFSETPLGDAVALMNQHSKTRMVVEDPTLAQMPVNGTFRADNTDTFVRLLEASFGIKAERSGDTVILRKAP